MARLVIFWGKVQGPSLQNGADAYKIIVDLSKGAYEEARSQKHDAALRTREWDDQEWALDKKMSYDE